MKAFIFSRDKLSYEVLERVLHEDDFTQVELKSPTTESVEAFGTFDLASLIMLDVDAKESAKLIKSLPSHIPLVCIGSHESLKTAPDGAKYTLRKPFSKVQVRQIVHDALIGGVRLPTAHIVTNQLPENAVDDLKIRWQQRLNAINVRRAELIQMLKATPEQLRILIQRRTGEVANDSRRIPSAIFPMGHALAVDSSEQNLKQMMHSFASKCVLQADSSQDGQAGWELLKSGPYDVLVLRWEVTQLNGLSFYNRLRSTERFRYLPVVILSSKVQTQDFRLLDEDLAVSLLPLPISEKNLSTALSQVISNAVLSREFIGDLTNLVREIQATSDVGLKEILSIKGQGHDDLINNALRLVGDRLLDEKNYAGAEWAFGTAWKMGDRRLSLVTGYGKACLYQGKNDDAMRLISVADAIAPKSVERLCLLGELELGKRHYPAAKLQFSKALVIDPEMRRAEAGIKIAEALEKHESAAKLKAPTDNFASYLNLIGINLSRTGNTAEAATYYESAMHFVHQPGLQAKLWFNLGLCYLRARRPKDARSAFELAIKLSDGMLSKAAKLLAEAKEAEAKGAVEAKQVNLDFEVL